MGIRGKSEVISQVIREEEVPSRNGVIRRFILHSVCPESHVYSASVVSSFRRRYVGLCHSNVVVTRVGSIVVSGGGFLRRISRVVRRELSDF